MGNPKRQLPEVHLTSQEIHTAPGVHLGLDAADKLTSAVVHLLAELASLPRGCRNLVGDLLKEIVDANKHVENRMPHAAKGTLLVQAIFVSLGIWKVEPAGVYGVGQIFQHLKALAFVRVGLNHSGVVPPEQHLGVAAGAKRGIAPMDNVGVALLAQTLDVESGLTPSKPKRDEESHHSNGRGSQIDLQGYLVAESRHAYTKIGTGWAVVKASGGKIFASYASRRSCPRCLLWVKS